MKKFLEFIKENTSKEKSLEFILTFYQVNIHWSRDTNGKYYGIDIDDAKKEFDLISDIDNEQEEKATVALEKCDKTFKFIGELLEDETIENDYPLEYYYIDKDVYELVDEDDWIEIESKELKGSEETAEDLMYEVEKYLKKDYGVELYAGYDKITLGYTKEDIDDDDCKEITIQFRVKEHSENPQNKHKSTADYFLSIVISNKNKTKDRFHSSTELYFDGDDNLDDIKSRVFQYIQEIIYWDDDIVKLSDNFIEAEHELRK
jgi:hypothetical protein